MYKVIFEYADGRRGTCREGGETKVFDTEQEAVRYAEELNARIDEDMKPYFPAYRAEKV